MKMQLSTCLDSGSSTALRNITGHNPKIDVDVIVFMAAVKWSVVEYKKYKSRTFAFHSLFLKQCMNRVVCFIELGFLRSVVCRFCLSEKAFECRLRVVKKIIRHKQFVHKMSVGL